MTLNTLLVFAWARFKPSTHVQLALARQTVDAESPAQVTACHATRVRPNRESGK